MGRVEEEVDEREESGMEEKGASGTKKSPTKLIFVSLFLAGLIGASFFSYRRFFSASSETGHGAIVAHKEEAGPLSNIGLTYSLDPFIVNLVDDFGDRYLKVNLTLELGNSLVKEELDKRLPQIRDIILILLSSKSFEDIKDVQGKLRLREEIMSKLNNTLITGEIRKVYFTEFVVQ